MPSRRLFTSAVIFPQPVALLIALLVFLTLPPAANGQQIQDDAAQEPESRLGGGLLPFAPGPGTGGPGARPRQRSLLTVNPQIAAQRLSIRVSADGALRGRRATVRAVRLRRVCLTRPQSPVPSCLWQRFGRSQGRSLKLGAWRMISMHEPPDRDRRTLVTISIRPFRSAEGRVEPQPVRVVTSASGGVLVVPRAARG